MRPLVGVSLKLYFSVPDSLKYIQDSIDHIPNDLIDKHNLDIFLVPDFLSIPDSSRLLEHSRIHLAAQDCFYEHKGAYTGEVSPASLAHFNCKLVELGHAERRSLFHESDADVARKAAAAVQHQILPLVCIGEPVRADPPEQAAAQCAVQIDPVLAAIPPHAPIAFAYEPVWAIGKPQPADPDYVNAVVRSIRNHITSSFPDRSPDSVRIIYGGSAGPGLFEKLAPSCDGLFLGRFAHDVEAFRRTIDEVIKAKNL